MPWQRHGQRKVKNGNEVREGKKFCIGRTGGRQGQERRRGAGKELGKGRQGGHRENKHGWSKLCKRGQQALPPNAAIALHQYARHRDAISAGSLVRRRRLPARSRPRRRMARGFSVTSYGWLLSLQLPLSASTVQNLMIPLPFPMPHLS